MKLCKLVVLPARYKCTEFDKVMTSFARAARVQSLHVHKRVKSLKYKAMYLKDLLSVSLQIFRVS